MTSRYHDEALSSENISTGDLSPSIIDMDIFSQLLEMDDEEDREFSKSIVWNYFVQAETTFGDMDVALASKDLPELSRLGHFLKGSSAAVGVIKVRDSCECMQHYGKRHDEDGISELTEEVAMQKITDTLSEVKVQYKEAEKALKSFYAEDGEEEEEEERGEEEREEEEEEEEEQETETKEDRQDANGGEEDETSDPSRKGKEEEETKAP
ncbi:histidine-phosphotransfer domain, HPT domain-containing protein [Violaceomyces palustris]|uniref:Histidine-phosphotransfer domain, HPT domain-containing protein n=1 Tax=Violaceomyces palustris TaxID=1673888 RepID=A0ACD0P109_9BASI|nr:histidine-phosphotransfer domain, HPT domain-containing protein [Violaceomyces palustris]